jgi:RNA polymerase sigma-70 factor (ECF subfamily)
MSGEAVHSLRDELPAHGRWVQRLARSLVRDAAVAEDLAQEAQLAALRRGDSSASGLGPWLARVTRNLAHRNRRDAARRASRERAAARTEAEPGADETAARVEIQRRLVEEVARLEPPLRQVVVRHYFDGWTSARIARETGEPAATVRWRLQRGLAELRRRLDRASGGDGIQWRLALLPVSAGGSPLARLWEPVSPLAAGALPGVLTMKAVQVVAVGAVATAVGLGIWWSAERETPGRSDVEAAPAKDTAALAAPEPAAEAPIAPLETPEVREALSPATPSPAAANASTSESSGPFRAGGRCVDETLVPVLGARVREVGVDPPHTVVTGSDGAFALKLAPDRVGVRLLRVDAEGLATRLLDLTVREDREILLGDVILVPAGILSGRVIGPDGSAFSGATLVVTAPDLLESLEAARVQGPGDPERRLGALSGPGGEFEIAGVAPGTVRVWAGAPGMRYAISAPVFVAARERSEPIELRLEELRADDRIRGIVRSPEGEPVARAAISGFERAGGGGSSLQVDVGDDGRFELKAKRGYVYDLEAYDAEDRWARVAIEGILPGAQDVELRFLPSRWIEVLARGPGGEPVEEFVLGASDADGWMFERVWDTSHPGGRARLRVPTSEFSVAVEARGFVRGLRGPFRPDEAPATLELDLEPQPGVHGRVVTGGRPLAGARVALYRAASGTRIEHKGYPSLVDPNEADATTTDGEGRFVLSLARRGSFFVRAEGEGLAAGELGPFELDPETGRRDLELELGPGGALEGRVLLPAGRDPSGVIVALNRGDAHALTVRSDEEGRFAFERLMPGLWHLSRGTIEVDSLLGGTSYSGANVTTTIPYNCTIRPGEITRQDLDLRDFEACELNGVLTVNGAPAASWVVTAWPGARQVAIAAPPSTALAADGSFTVVVDEPGPLRLDFSPPAEEGGDGRIDALTEVRPGPNDWSADFAMGRVIGRAPSIEPGDTLAYVSGDGVVPHCWLPIHVDDAGRFVLPYAPAGAGAIQHLFHEADGDTSWEILVETDVPAGGERRIDLP